MAELCTFDVFDTVIVRRVGTPEAAFLAMGHRLHRDGIVPWAPEAFARVRGRVEPMVARRSRTRQATLEGIAEELVRLLELPSGSERMLVEYELDLERTLLVPVPSMRAHLDQLRFRGHEIAFVSDMYLSSDFIASVLHHHGLLVAGEVVHVSSEIGCTKRSGELFAHVLERHGQTPSSTRHIGDDLHSDVHQARAAGIAAEHVTTTALNRYEQVLEAHRWDSSGVGSALAGASRLARLSTPARTEHEEAIRDVTAGVAGPLLVGYVAWVLRRASALGIDRLYFVSRDGEVLLDIAERLSDGIADVPQLAYLYGSRQAWYPAGVDPSDPRAALQSMRHDTDDSLAVLLDRCGVDAASWLASDLDAGIDELQLARLLEDPSFLADVSAGVRARQERLARYLKGAGLLGAGRSGVVDLGWQGRSLDGLSTLVEAHGGAVPTGFYMGLVPEGPLRQSTEVWLRGMEHRLHIALTETFCTAAHGQVLDYEVDADGLTGPVLARSDNEAAIAWGLPTLRATLERFVDEYRAVLPLFPAAADVRPAVVASFELFYRHPTATEARTWGAFPFEVAAAGKAEPLVLPRGCSQRVVDRVSGGATYRWLGGDTALAPRSWQALRRATASVKVSVRYLGRRHRRWRQ